MTFLKQQHSQQSENEKKFETTNNKLHMYNLRKVKSKVSLIMIFQDTTSVYWISFFNITNIDIKLRLLELQF